MGSFDLVTGGAGFIGSHLVKMLLKRERRVKVIDNLSTGRTENLVGLGRKYGERFKFVEGDIRDVEMLKTEMDGCTTVYHQAAIPSVHHSVVDPLSSNSVNVTGTLNVLVSAKDASVSSVVLASSCAVYGDSPELPKQESMLPEPLSPYAVTKRTDELYASVFSSIYGLSCISLRYFNVFGPGQDPSSDYAAVIPRFVQRMIAGQSPVIFGDGEQSRDFIYVENVVEANILAATSGASGSILNIGSGRRRTLNQLVSNLNGILGSDTEPIYEEPRPGDIKDSEGDVSKAREVIRFEPRISFRSGLERTVDWFRAQGGEAWVK